MRTLDARTRLLALTAALGVVAAVVTGCSGGDPVPLGTPIPPLSVTSPTPVPSEVPTTAAERPTEAAPTVPPVPVKSSDLGSLVPPVVIAPTHLSIGTVDIDMSVLPMGVDQAGQMELPEDSSEAGWYEYGPAPADAAGTTVIAAHVDSLEFGLGQFVRLRDITAGETVSLTTADGSSHVYSVTQITRTPKTDVALDEIFDRTGAPRLVLVTCGGVFNRDTGHYLDNVIVTATPVA